MDRIKLKALLKTYQTDFDLEASYIPRFIDLLEEKNCFLRINTERHFTGSAWILNPDLTKVMLIHHKKLNKWLQPGGHADGNENLLEVALNEAKEETGVEEFQHINNEIFDIDIHLIPEHQNLNAHLHYDVRFIFTSPESTIIVKSDEVDHVRWVELENVKNYTGDNNSLLRMVEKTKRLFL